MKSRALAGYALAGWVLVTTLIFGGLYEWLHALTAQGDGRQFYVLVYLLCSPMVGGAIGIPAGIAFGNHREKARPGERPSVLRLRPPTNAPASSPPEESAREGERGPAPVLPRASAASAINGITLLVVALVPGLLSAILWWSDPAGALKQAFGDVLGFWIYIGPIGLALGLVYGGLTELRRARRGTG